MYLLNLLSCQFLAFLPRPIRFDGLFRNNRPFLNQFSLVIISLLLMDFLLSLDEAALAICMRILCSMIMHFLNACFAYWYACI